MRKFYGLDIVNFSDNNQ